MAAGGIPTLAGVRYELQATLYHVPDLLNNSLAELRYQLPALTASVADVSLVPAFLNDFSVYGDVTGKRFYQAKQSISTGTWTIKLLAREGVLRQMYKQHASSPSATLGFVSNIPAPPLNRLINAAREHANLWEFLANLSKSLRVEFTKLRKHLAGEGATDAKLYSMLNCAEFKLLTEDAIIARLRDFATDRYGDPVKFVDRVRDYIEKHPGRTIDADVLQTELDKDGLYRFPVEVKESVVTIFRRASGDLRSYVSQIAGIHIPREETGALASWIESLGSGKGVAALLDVAGSGKSVIAHDLLHVLEERGVPVLAIKADLLTSSVMRGAMRSAKDILRLPADPEALLAAAARKCGRAVLIVDQIDALSMTFARDQAMLDLMLSIVSRAATIDGVAVVFSCRAFDRHYDPKIRRLSAAREETIKSLTKDQIELVLNKINVAWDQLTERERKLLELPQHLDLFARIMEENKKRGGVRRQVASVQDLYDLLWELIVTKPPAGTVTAAEITEAIHLMADAIETSQSLGQAVTVLDAHVNARHYLESSGILRREGPSISFFHQSFFDYVFARRFTAREYSLVKYIRRSDQGLFQRPILRQVLTYLRSSKHSECIAQVSALLTGAGAPPIRYHLKNLTFAWFGEQVQLSDQEIALGLQYVRRNITRTEFLRGVRGNADWFKAIEPALNSLLDSHDGTIDVVVRYLESVQELCAAEVYKMLLPRLGSSDQWNNRVRWCILRHEKWRSDESGRCLVWFYENDPEPWDRLDFVLPSVAKANIQLGCSVLRVLLRRLHEAWLPTVRRAEHKAKKIRPKPGGNADSAAIRQASAYLIGVKDLFPRELHGIVEVVQACSIEMPKEYLSCAVPWLELVALDGRSWSAGGGLREFANFQVGFDEAGEDSDRDFAKALLRGIRASLIALARSDTQEFLNWATKIAKSAIAVLHQLLMQAIIAEPKPYANWAHEYLLADPARMNLGSHGDSCRYSGTLVGAIFQHLSFPQRMSLEEKILCYHPEWERDEEGDDRFAGISQLELLWDIPNSLLAKTSKAALRRLRRKFKGVQPRHKPDYRLTRVESPLPQEKAIAMSSQQWLEKMRQFGDDTSWGKKRERSKGGIVELSRQFEEEVSKNSSKFLPLAKMFDASVSSVYCAALLTGLARSQLPTPDLYEIALSFNSQRPNDPVIERAINEIVEKRGEKSVSDEVLKVLRYIALTSTDPAPERKQKQSSGHSSMDDPHHCGFNSVRGRALRLYVIFAARLGEKEAPRLLKALSSFSNDPSTGVRACLIDILPTLIRAQPKAALKAFMSAMKGHPKLLDSRVTHEFVYWSLRRHLARMLPLLALMMKSELKDTRIAAGRLATLAWFYKPSVNRVYEQCIKGEAALRHGVAEVLSHNVEDPKLRQKCLRELKRLFNDNNNEVGHSIAHTFDRLPLPTKEIIRFTWKYLSSKAIAASPDWVARYAARCQLSDGPFALEIAERLLKRFGSAVTDHSQSTGMLDDDLVNISMCVYRTESRPALKWRAMELFEQALRIGSMFAKRALAEADR